MPNPISGKVGLHELPHGLFGAGFAVQAADLDTGVNAAGQAGVSPDNVGLTVWNATGSTITAGQLLYVSGWNGTHSMPQVSLAAATAPNLAAQWVAIASILNGASGLVGKHFSLGSLNTNAATVGDAVWLDTTAGGYTLTNPTLTNATLSQAVGLVAVKSATVGVVDFNVLNAATNRVLFSHAAFIPTTIPTTGAAEAIFIVPVSGWLTNFRVFGKDALATDNTNFIQFGAVNHGHVDGTGTTQMLNQAAGASSTKTTGGGALIAYGGTSLVPSATAGNLVVAINDVIQFTATITGTLGNTVTEASVRMGILPSGN